MITTHNLTTLYGTTHDVAVGKETISRASELGVTHTETNGKVWCQGQNLKVDGNVIQGVLVMSQYKITLEKEEYIIPIGGLKAKDMIEAKFDRVILPKTCSRTNGVCSTSQCLEQSPR